MQGIGEGVQSFVTAPHPVYVQEWLIKPHTIVTAGTPVAIVLPANPQADFDLLRSQLEMERLRSAPSLAEDNAMDFERIRVELLKIKSELAIARVKLQFAEKEVARNAPLYREKLVSEDIYELSLNDRDELKAEVDEKAKAIVQIEDRLRRLRPIGEPDETATRSGHVKDWMLELERTQAAAARNLEPLALVASITGLVGLPLRQAGEFVPLGEPLAAVSSLQSEHVVAYLRQPYRFDPRVGMTARVTTRTHQRQSFVTRVVQVGAQMEVLTNSVALWRPGSLVDAALPIVLNIPDGISIRPGEVVDVAISESEPSKEMSIAPEG